MSISFKKQIPGYVGNLWVSFFSAAHRYYYARVTLSVAAALLSCVLVYLLYAFIASVVNSFALMQNGIDFEAMLPLGFLFVDVALGVLLITGMFFLRGILKLLKHVSKEEALASERLTEET